MSNIIENLIQMKVKIFWNSSHLRDSMGEKTGEIKGKTKEMEGKLKGKAKEIEGAIKGKTKETKE